MNIFEEQIGNNLHHTYLVEGDPNIMNGMLLNFLESRGVNVHGNPNIFSETYESLTIAQVRLIKQYHSLKASMPGVKIFIISALTINHEAEHALLKLFEEPAENTHLFFILPTVDTLPATLLSRAHVLREHHPEQNIVLTHAKEFLTQSPKDRIAIVAKIVASHKDDDTSASLRDDARMLIDSCEQIIHQKNKIITNDDAWKLQEIIKARKYLSTSGVSVKMILEHLALVL